MGVKERKIKTSRFKPDDRNREGLNRKIGACPLANETVWIWTG